MDEYVNGRKVRHNHLFNEMQGSAPDGVHGNVNRSLIHAHPVTERQHLHPLLEVWEEDRSVIPPGKIEVFFLYGPAQDLPDEIESWSL